MYIVRDSAGIMIAKFTNKTADMLLRLGEGFFRPYNTGEKRVVAFELTQDHTFTVADVTMYLWKGTLLIPTTD